MRRGGLPASGVLWAQAKQCMRIHRRAKTHSQEEAHVDRADGPTCWTTLSCSCGPRRVWAWSKQVRGHKPHVGLRGSPHDTTLGPHACMLAVAVVGGVATSEGPQRGAPLAPHARAPHRARPLEAHWPIHGQHEAHGPCKGNCTLSERRAAGRMMHTRARVAGLQFTWNSGSAVSLERRSVTFCRVHANVDTVGSGAPRALRLGTGRAAGTCGQQRANTRLEKRGNSFSTRACVGRTGPGARHWRVVRRAPW